MGKIFFWENYKNPVKVKDLILKKEIDVHGHYVCLDERVEKAWITASRSNESNIELFFHVIFKDGGRIEKRLSLPATQQQMEDECEIFLREESVIYPLK